MIAESIKSVLGAELSATVENALKGKGKNGGDIDLVCGNDGTFVPADKFNGEKSGKTSAETALKAAAEALKAIGGSGDPAKLADDVATAKTKFETLQSDHATELKKINTDTAIRMALAGKVHDPADIIGMLDGKVELDDAGAIKGSLDDLLKPIKESKPYLFVEDKPAEIGGVKPAAGGQQTESPKANGGPVTF